MTCNYSHILIIDDDHINNLLNRQFLTFCLPKVIVTPFQDATQVLHYLKEEKIVFPDLILLDINMPEMDGWEFLNSLDNLSVETDVMILSSSLHFEDIDKSKGFKAVKCYIEKPLTEEKIEQFISQQNFSGIELD